MSTSEFGRSSTEPSTQTHELLTALGWSDRWVPLLAASSAANASPGRVVRHDGAGVLVALATGTAALPVRRTTEPIAVGDWVVVEDDAVVDVLPRHSLLQRRDPSTGFGQLLAANLDVVVIVLGLDRPVRAGRIQRFVTQAWDAGAEPLVVLTKADLAVDVVDSVDEAARSAPALDVVTVAAVDGTGIDELTALLTGRTAVFVGESGAGKSTLLNALANDDLAAAGSVRAGDHKGRHTTTARQLHALDNGICIIDTPGVREVGLWTDAQTVDAVFDDLLEFADSCRFRDCEHDTEPGCAVHAAVESGELDADRLASWRRLRAEALAAEMRADPQASRQAGKAFGRMVREAKRLKRPDR